MFLAALLTLPGFAMLLLWVCLRTMKFPDPHAIKREPKKELPTGNE